jgi:hypothetical protein
MATKIKGYNTQPEDDMVQPTQTEQAFGLAGEDTAMSMEDYRKQQEEEYAGQAEAAFNEYLSKLDPEDAEYQREQLSELPTNSMLDIIYDEDRDSVDKYMDPESEPAKEREFVLKHVPRAIAPYVRVVAKGGGFVVVKPLAEIEDVVAEGIAKTIREHESREISQGATIAPRELTIREKHQGAIANILQKVGMAQDGRSAHRMAKDFVGDPTADSVLGGLGAADITPLGALYAFDESADEISTLNKRDDVGAVDYIAPVAVAGLSALEALPVTKGLAKAGKRLITGKRVGQAPKTIDEIRVEVDAQIASGESKKRAEKARNKFDLGKAREATEAVEQSKKEAARKVAQTEEGQAIAESALLEYEDTLRKLGIIGEDEKITRKVFGKTVIDYEKAKNIGKSRLDDLDLPDDTVSELGFGADGYRMAVPNPDLLDKFVAVVKTVQDANPDLIGKPTKTKGITRKVYEAAVKNPEMLRSKELMDALDEFGLSFEDFVLQVNAGASIAGQVLNRSAQFGRAIKKSRAQVDEEETMEALNKMGGFGKGMRRFVNVSRGALVGTVATAMRNFEGFLVRAPLEGLSNVFENAIHAVATKGAKGLAPNSFKQSYAKSYRGLGEMLRDRKSMEAFTDFILKRDEFDAEYKQMFETVNEIRLGLGRGEATTKVGKGADFVLSKMEDYVHLANTPNRMQEFLARRTAFMTKLETLVKREYGVDLVDALNNGRMHDLMRGDTSLVGVDKRSWNELVGDAVESAMDQTYANGPRNDHLKELLRMFNKIPGGVGGFALPFPRFMLKAAEYMYETTLGLPTAATRRIFGMGEEGGKFVTSQGKVTYNAQMAARGMAGWTAIGGFTMAANAGLITDDNKVVLPGGKKLDVTYQFPLGQLVFMGQMFNKALSSEKDFVEWWDGRQARDLFLGVNFRGNTGLGQLMDDTMLMFQNELKAGKGEKTAEAMGQFVADRMLWIAQPYQQVIDLERGFGFRDTIVRDYESDPTMDMGGSFKKGFGERLQQRGYTTQEGGLTAYLGEAMGMGMEEGDRAAPIKQKATKEGGTDRGQVGSLIKFALGLNIMERNTEEQQFFKKFGYNDWDLASRTGVGTVDNAVNETLSGILPSVAQSLMRVEERFIEQGKSDTFIKKEMKARIKQLTNEVKQKIYNTGIKAKGADDPAYVDALFRLRTFNAEAQAVIQERFFDSQGRYPDLTSTEDIRAMVQIGDRARYKRKLLN